MTSYLTFQLIKSVLFSAFYVRLAYSSSQCYSKPVMAFYQIDTSKLQGVTLRNCIEGVEDSLDEDSLKEESQGLDKATLHLVTNDTNLNQWNGVLKR